MLGVIRHQRGDHEDAVRHIDAALMVNPRIADAYGNRGVALQRLERFDEAVASYDRQIALAPGDAGAFYNRGNALQALNRFDEAVVSYDQAITLKPDYAGASYNRGNALQALNRFDEAIASYDQAIALNPGHADAFNNRGAVLQRLKRFDEAVASYDRAIALAANDASTFYNRGIALQALERFEQAVASYDRAIVLRPGYAGTFYNRGNALQALRRFEEALASYDRAITLKPDYAEAHNSLGNALQMIDRRAEAIAHYQSALSINPNFAPALLNLGNALMALYRYAEAEMCFRRSVALLPKYVEAHVDLGSALWVQYKSDQAIACFEEALSLKPDHVVAHTGLGVCLVQEGRKKEALAALRRAAALRPGFLAEWHACMANLPIVYHTEAEIEESRSAYSKALTMLTRNFPTDDLGTVSEALRALDASKPFFLPYQGRCDRDLQSTYGALVARMMAARYPEYAERPEMPSRSSGSPIRVGILSGFFHQHSVWKIPMRGWMEGLSRDRFEVHCYYTDTSRDSCTEAARNCCVKFIDGPREIDAWASIIRADALNVLIIPEIGMHPMTLKLSALRLAPFQVTSWGHPNTSGLPTIDYFLSSDLMEPQNAADHYTETLVRLPNLGIHYQSGASSDAKIARCDLGFADSDVLYWCCQSLYKYRPEYDWIFAKIATAIPNARFLFIRHSSDFVTGIFRERLDKTFAAEGLDAKRHCAFLNRLPFEQFMAHSAACDLFLDSPGWSGCNSALEGIATNLPIVTHRGGLMRGRHCTAILEMIGMCECIADTIEDFVAMAIRMGKDPDLRRSFQERIDRGKEAIYLDLSSVRALEHFIERTVESLR